MVNIFMLKGIDLFKLNFHSFIEYGNYFANNVLYIVSHCNDDTIGFDSFCNQLFK